jgi:hypothetical protein
MFPLLKYKRDFQIFITIVIKPIMEFIQFLFQIFLFMIKENKKGLKIFITIVISKCYLEILHRRSISIYDFIFCCICELIQGTTHASHYHI